MTKSEQSNHIESSDPLYRVVWKFRDGSHQGCGSPIIKEFADATAREMNNEYPMIRHWIEQVTP